MEKIQIASRRRARELVSEAPGELVAILVYEPGCYGEVEQIAAGCKQALCLEMADFVAEREFAPTLLQVSEALHWLRPNLVACHQGVSRSAALAFLIQCTLEDPWLAAEIWDPAIHYPNELILKHGVALLGEHLASPVRHFYRKLAAAKGWKVEMTTKFFR